MDYQLFHGDCLEVLPTLPPQSVDAIICDPPFGTTSCSWDSVIPFPPMWEQLKRIIKPSGAVVLFGSEPFSSLLRCSNLDWYKYDWVWDKGGSTNFQLSAYQPLKAHENIMVFSDAPAAYNKNDPMRYNPQMTKRTTPLNTQNWRSQKNRTGDTGAMRIRSGLASGKIHESMHPTTILSFNMFANECNNLHRIHPSQKSVDLLSYLIKTYTNEGDIILDFTMGSGSTIVAAIECGRKAIGIEKDAHYFQVASERIETAYRKMNGLSRLGKATDSEDLPLFSIA